MRTRNRAASVLVAIGLLALAPAAQAGTLLSEGFDNVAGLGAAGWASVNLSSPLGTTDWFQGNPAIFTSQAGADDSYLAANFDNAGFGGTIDNWGMTPELSIRNGDRLSFWTRTELGSVFPDRLEVRLSTNGSSTAVADFSTLLLSINPLLSIGGYPEAWTEISVSVSGLGAPATGRYAIRYWVTDTSTNGDYIGVDTLRVVTPEPGTGLLLALGGLALAIDRRRRTR